MKNSMIYPELGGTTNDTIEYRVSHQGGFYITTDLELSGRGINPRGDGSDHKRGKKTYQITEMAFKNLQTQYDTCFIASL